ncbi:MAG: hypothetical protein HY753_02895 [Nitrospirae bacterium]|nr:hypothetical protein [Nitrospirota bacterium]
MPLRGALSLVIIFLAVPTVVFFGLWVMRIESLKLVLYAEVFFLHVALSLAYIATYPAVRAVSPSLDILLIIAASEKGKLHAGDIISRYNNKNLITDKIDVLRIYNFIQEKEGVFTISPLAKFVVLGFLLYRKLLGLRIGEG